MRWVRSEDADATPRRRADARSRGRRAERERAGRIRNVRVERRAKPGGGAGRGVGGCGIALWRQPLRWACLCGSGSRRGMRAKSEEAARAIPAPSSGASKRSLSALFCYVTLSTITILGDSPQAPFGWACQLSRGRQNAEGSLHAVPARPWCAGGGVRRGRNGSRRTTMGRTSATARARRRRRRRRRRDRGTIPASACDALRSRRARCDARRAALGRRVG